MTQWKIFKRSWKNQAISKIKHFKN